MSPTKPDSDSLITIHDEEDELHRPIVVATCECGRTWLLYDGRRYKYSSSSWRTMKDKHMQTLRHLKGILDNHEA